MLVCGDVCDDVFDVVCDVDIMCDGVFDGVNGGEGSGKVKWMILSWWGVLVTDRQTNKRTLVVVESLSRLKTDHKVRS